MITDTQTFDSSPNSLAIHETLVNCIRSYGVDQLALVPFREGVALEGFSRSYYGKQMAQELVRSANFVVVTNRIRVKADSEIVSV